MNVKEENICRLCLKVADNDFIIIDEVTRKIFEVISLKVNLDISKDPVICNDCKEMSIKCFGFKSACMDTEKLIFSFDRDTDRAMFESYDIYSDVKDIKIADDICVCRFCSNHLSRSNFVLLNTLKEDFTFAQMLPRLMPETDFNVIKNPLICTSCMQNLKCYIEFVRNCWDVEEKITKYCQNEDIPFTAPVKLNEIWQFLFKTTVELNSTQTYGIKQEKEELEEISETRSETYNSELIKAEEPLDIKEHEINIKETPCETPLKMPTPNSNISCGLRPEIISEKACSKKYKSAVERKGNLNLSNQNVSETKIYKCPMCTYEAKYKRYLTSHTLIHKDVTEVKMYKCSICSYQTRHRGDLKSHTLKHKNITEVEMYKCPMCTYVTKHKGSLKIHTIVHKDISEVEIYKCFTCTYETKHKSSLKTHMLIHKDVTEVEMYKCSMCTYETKRKNDLKFHTLAHKDVTEVELYKCSMCDYRAKHKDYVKRHELIHKDMAKLYKCSMCAYETRQKDSLKRHVLIHSDVTDMEMYKCLVCNLMTKQKSSLKRHMLVHKNIMELEMYKCSMCPFQTKHKGSIKSHELTHKNATKEEKYKCSMCTYKTTRKRMLSRHMAIHKVVTKKIMHKCSTCTYSTNQESSLKTHMLIHKNITDIVCNAH